MKPSLRAHLLGGFRVEANGQLVQLSGSRTARSLLAYLLLSPDRQHLRSKLAGMYWPEQSEPVARERLRSVLYRLGKNLDESGVPVLDQAREWVGTSADIDVWVDATEFRSLIGLAQRAPDGAGDQLQKATDLYQGEFMPGHYEDWVFAEQQSLHHAQAAALAQLLAIREADGQFDRALLVAKRMVALDWSDENAHRTIMRLSALLRRPEDALRQYREVRRTLKHQLGTEPALATTQLAADIASHVESTLSSPPTSDRSQAPVFVARQAERDLLIGALERALSVEGSVALIEGPPGVGKSSLLEQAGEDAKWRNYEILRGSYQDRIGGEAFEGLRGALDAALTPLRIEQLRSVCDPMWLEEASRVIPRLGGRTGSRSDVTGEDGRWKVQESLLQVLRSLASIYPTMLLLEDVHWADLDSLAVIKRLAVDMANTPLVVLLSYRREEAETQFQRWAMLQDIDRSVFSKRLVLGDLSAQAVTHLINAIGGFGEHAGELAEWLVDHTGGNPLFVVETLKSLREDDPGHPFEMPDRIPVASSVAEIVEHRLARLEDTARQVIDAAAVFARPASTSQLAELTDLDYPAVLEAVTTVVRRQVLSDQLDGLLFSHELIRRVAYDGIHPDRLCEIHIRSAEVLIDLVAAPAEIAHHYYEAQDWEATIQWSQKAAGNALDISAYDTARTHYQRAIEAADVAAAADDDVFELLDALERVADVLGDRAEQTELIDRMEGLASTAVQKAETKLRTAWLMAHTDRFAEAEAAAIAGYHLAPDRHEDFGRVLAQIQIWSARPADAVATLEKVVAAVDGPAAGSTYLLLGTAYVEAGMHDRSEVELRNALDRYREAGDRGGEARTLGILGTVIGEQRRLEDAEVALREGREIACQIGYRIADAECTVNLATILYQRNRPAEALAAYESAEDAFRSIGQQRGLASTQSNVASVSLQVFGDAEGAYGAAASAREYFAEVGEEARLAVVESLLAGIRAETDPELASSEFAAAAERVLATPDRYRSKIVLLAYLNHLLDIGRFAEAQIPFRQLTEVDPDWGKDRNEKLLKAWYRRETGDEGWIETFDDLLIDLDESVQIGARIAWGAFLVAGDDADRAKQAIDLANRLIARDFVGVAEVRIERASAQRFVRRLRSAHVERNTQQITVEVPRQGTPGGRAARADEIVVTPVTVWRPSDSLIDSETERRRVQLERIVREIEEAGAVAGIKHLARVLDVSQATIKRDLSTLRARGQLIVTRGSA
ncbi:MAG: AAA family ATPase [Acidimicrobiia bacterium]|nr:AAA family ATPase [Acidimicrobiia bacterium]MDH5503777.1 AAA family ATPase [Acidimicrobiia bacterium]